MPASPAPRPGEGDGPVFREPWEARAFAAVIGLHEAGCFTWAEWTETLAAEISGAQAAGDRDLGDTYYQHWLAALERLTAKKQLVAFPDLVLRRLEVAANATPHAHAARRDPVAIAPGIAPGIA